jgi:IS30 family transposase
MPRPGEKISAAYRDWGYTMKEIADHLGCHYSTISRRTRQAEQTNRRTAKQNA